MTFINKVRIIKEKTMYLNVILTIYVIVQIITMVLIYKWWKKYGKSLFKTFTELKNLPMGGMKSGQMPDMSKMMGDLMNMTKNMGKFK